MKSVFVVAMVCWCGLVIASGKAEDRRPSKWGGGSTGYDVVLDSETKHGGESSARLSKSPDDNQRKFRSIVQSISASNYAGKRVRFSGHIKTENVASHAGLWLRVDSEERGTVAFENMMRRSIKGTNDWTKHEIVIDVPADGGMITFGAMLAGDGKIWVDDLALEIVTGDVETTSEPIKPINQKAKIPATLEKEPQNLSFES